MSDSDDDVIDLAGYIKRKQEETSGQRTTFTLWGGDGERVRFALPLWRAAYLGGGLRAALVSLDVDDPPDAEPRPLVILDLREETARLDFSTDCLDGLEVVAPPGSLGTASSAVSVYLGEQDGRRWFMVVDDLSAADEEVEGRTRGDLLFLAGECAGLLFFRGLASDSGGEAGG